MPLGRYLCQKMFYHRRNFLDLTLVKNNFYVVCLAQFIPLEKLSVHSVCLLFLNNNKYYKRSFLDLHDAVYEMR